ncbi:MAG: hypothetical protein EHM34_06190 [Nitrosopumilales archaeon]|nr:MAG: hypothetical protein EHM34_06190 [Nitrosopumilales archaeon]
MKKKHRNIVVSGETYGWTVTCCGTILRIWLNKQIIHEESISVFDTFKYNDGNDYGITPKFVKDVIKTKILNQVVSHKEYLDGRIYD